MERIPMTPMGLEALQKELVQLKTVERPANIQAIEEARAHGDLSENAEYHAAKERQGFIAFRITDLEYKIGCAEVIDPKDVPKDRAIFGTTVVLENLDTGEEVTYQLVGTEESDAPNGKISVSSPLGAAMLGKQVDEECKVRTPGGEKNYVIVEIL